jgi:hypothetical protein
MLLKHASRTKCERMILAITVLEMPTMSIVKGLELLRAINWTDARPWIVMLGAVTLFLGWDLRKKRREIQKLDLEIAQLRSQQSLVQVATIHEMNSLIKDVEISARKLGNFRGHEFTRRVRYPFSRVSRFDVCEAVNRRVVRVGRSLEEISELLKQIVTFRRLSQGSKQLVPTSVFMADTQHIRPRRSQCKQRSRT